MVSVTVYDDRTGRDVDVPLPESLLQEMAHLVFGSAVWRRLVQGGELPGSDTDVIRHKHRRWQAALRAAMAAPTPKAPYKTAPIDTPDAMLASARARREAGASWRDVARETGLSVATLRRRLAA